MELNLKIKTNKKTKEKQKSSFLPYFIVIVVLIALAIITLVYNKYNFYIEIGSKKEKIEVNAIYSNLQNDL